MRHDSWGNLGWKSLLVPQKTRAGEQWRRRMRRFTPGIARFLNGDTNSWACTRYWTRVHREVNSSYACPLPVHATELSRRHIPVRLYQIFDRIGATVPGYRAGVRWCNSCSKPADENSKVNGITVLLKRYFTLYSSATTKKHTCIHWKILAFSVCETFYEKAGSYFSRMTIAESNLLRIPDI